jgi:hypothetical protein
MSIFTIRADPSAAEPITITRAATRFGSKTGDAVNAPTR